MPRAKIPVHKLDEDKQDEFINDTKDTLNEYICKLQAMKDNLDYSDFIIPQSSGNTIKKELSNLDTAIDDFEYEIDDRTFNDFSHYEVDATTEIDGEDDF